MSNYLLHFLFATVSFFCSYLSFAQHTFSIIAIDSVTKEIGSAGATCLDTVLLKGEEGALVISEIIPGLGAIHTQAMWNPQNQKYARELLKSGLRPHEVLQLLQLNDNKLDGKGIDYRQYGIVSIHNGIITSAAFTGKSNEPIAFHLTGRNYSIQGNILLDQNVLYDMEKSFLNSEGSLADRLMAAMQGAKRPGADSRCLSENVSALSAFLRVASPEEHDPSYGSLVLDINIPATPYGIDPIDRLQDLYNNWVYEQEK